MLTITLANFDWFEREQRGSEFIGSWGILRVFSWEFVVVVSLLYLS